MKKLSLYVFLVFILFFSGNVYAEKISLDCVSKFEDGDDTRKVFHLDSNAPNISIFFREKEIEWNEWVDFALIDNSLKKNEKFLRFNHIVDRYTGFMKSLVYNVTIDDLYSSDNLDTFGTGKCSKVEEEKKF